LDVLNFALLAEIGRSGALLIFHGFCLFIQNFLFFKLSSRDELIEQWCVKKITQYWGWRLFLMITMMVYLIIFAGPTGVPAFIYYRF
jgi:hypothetical protein